MRGNEPSSAAIWMNYPSPCQLTSLNQDNKPRPTLSGPGAISGTGFTPRDATRYEPARGLTESPDGSRTVALEGMRN